MTESILLALLGGWGVAIAAGPMGSFVVWRRMAYFGDALSHSALLGVGLGLLLQMDLLIGILAVCVAAALILVFVESRWALSGDTVLGILAHSGLALGLVAVSFVDNAPEDLEHFLFGDVLNLEAIDLIWIYIAAAIVLGLVARFWRPLLNMTVHEAMARAEGVPVPAMRIGFMVLMALVVAVAMKIVGVLLITALLVIPSATARIVSRTPEAMAVFAAIIGCLAVALGITVSAMLGTPAGPSIVVAALMMFLISLVYESIRKLS